MNYLCQKNSCAFWVLSLIVFIFSSSTNAGKRIALVIGNGDYLYTSSLKNPIADARLMSRTLSALGFDVIERLNADQKDMKTAINLFGGKLERGGKSSVGLFYFAGHGVQVEGQNYLIPVSANIQKESQVDVESVNASFIMKTMEYSGNSINLVVLDACRNNPYKSGFRSANRGLARISAPTGTLVAYATSPGDVAADGNGVNSPYTRALTRAMAEEGMPVEQVFKKVRISVMRETDQNQVPWELSSLTGDFYFRPGNVVSSSLSIGSSKPLSLEDEETKYWNRIKNKKNKSNFIKYLDRYPKGKFSSQAKKELKNIKKREFDRKFEELDDSLKNRMVKVDRHGKRLSYESTNWDCVLDTNTGLMWEAKERSGLRSRESQFTWEQSAGYSKSINQSRLCGYSDWGVPNKDELGGLANVFVLEPYLYVKFFPNTKSSWYWTGSMPKGGISHAHGYNFSSGKSGVGGKSMMNHVRLVRTASE